MTLCKSDVSPCLPVLSFGALLAGNVYLEVRVCVVYALCCVPSNICLARASCVMSYGTTGATFRVVSQSANGRWQCVLAALLKYTMGYV